MQIKSSRSFSPIILRNQRTNLLNSQDSTQAITESWFWMSKENKSWKSFLKKKMNPSSMSSRKFNLKINHLMSYKRIKFQQKSSQEDGSQQNINKDLSFVSDMPLQANTWMVNGRSSPYLWRKTWFVESTSLPTLWKVEPISNKKWEFSQTLTQDELPDSFPMTSNLQPPETLLKDKEVAKKSFVVLKIILKIHLWTAIKKKVTL